MGTRHESAMSSTAVQETIDAVSDGRSVIDETDPGLGIIRSAMGAPATPREPEHAVAVGRLRDDTEDLVTDAARPCGNGTPTYLTAFGWSARPSPPSAARLELRRFRKATHRLPAHCCSPAGPTAPWPPSAGNGGQSRVDVGTSWPQQ